MEGFLKRSPAANTPQATSASCATHSISVGNAGCLDNEYCDHQVYVVHLLPPNKQAQLTK
jgi:hypothetical protein